MKLVFRFGRYKLNTFTNLKLKVKNFVSFSVSYIFAIIIIIIIIIIIYDQENLKRNFKNLRPGGGEDQKTTVNCKSGNRKVERK